MIDKLRLAAVLLISHSFYICYTLPMLYPVEKSNELIDAINAMVESGQNDLKIAGIRRDALKLEKAGKFVESRHVLGMLAAFQGDAGEVDRHFKAAEVASGNAIQYVVNHAVALSNLRRFRLSLETIDRAVARAPDDVFVLAQAASIHLDAYDAAGALELLDRLHRLGKDIRGESSVIETQLLAKSSVLAENNTSWSEIADRIELAANVLSSLGFFPMSCPVLETLGDGAMLYEISLNTDAEGAAKAEDAIIDAIASQPYSPADKAIVFYCLPV